ncbi:MAG: ComEC/Rec2 family competence protein [Clostridiaceae bacterium]
MHLLALAVIVYLISLYLLSAKLIALLIIVLIPFVYYFGREKKIYILIVLMIPVVSWMSLTKYYHSPIPSEIRVNKILYSSIIGTNHGRQFLVEGNTSDLHEGDILKGNFTLERMPINRNGYVGTLTVTKSWIEKDQVSKFRRIKNDLINEVIEIYGFDRGSLMASLALGYQEDINEKRETDMKALGVLHILSISGFHFALIEAALKKLKVKKTYIVIIILLYALFIDSIPGYRTLITLLYRMIAFYLRKDPENVTGLLFAMFIQSFISPYLIFKTGFLLTYLSTLGILLFYLKILKRLTHLPLMIIEPFALTLSALSLAFPIILTFQPDFSLGIFIGNMVLVPVYTLVTYFSFIAIATMKIPMIVTLLRPFVEIFFDLAYYLGSFLGTFNIASNFEHLLYIYCILFFISIILLRRGETKKILYLFLCMMILSLPIGTTLKVYNKYGVPFIRITHKLQVYDIIDYRAGEAGYISLRKETTLTLGEHKIDLIPDKKEKNVPEIIVDGRTLSMEESFEYFGGINFETGYIFFGERIIRYK